MSSFILSLSDSQGGAARAALRLHHAMLMAGHGTRMLVRERRTGEPNVECVSGSDSDVGSWRSKIGNAIFRLGRIQGSGARSGNWLPSDVASRIDGMGADVVNLHWVGAEMLSIEDIGRIRQPIVWTLHDMWPFCGSEHYAAEDPEARWRTGYGKDNRPAGSSGIDLDRLIWQRKLRHWQKPMHIVAPSRWLGDCARSSRLLQHYPIECIPNPLDTDVFRPLDMAASREALGLPQDVFLVAFGAVGGSADPRKGFDLLLAGLRHAANTRRDLAIHAVIFGQDAPAPGEELPVPAHWVGHIHDDATLALLYSAADAMVVPSRQENLPQTATEAQSCGCPVLAFDCTGLPDAVEHKVTGYLARAFDVGDLAQGLAWLYEDRERLAALRRNARLRAVQLWSPAVVLPKYEDVYRRAIAWERAA
ncbi:MAG: glycosyltransferase [Azoarcus sp.]